MATANDALRVLGEKQIVNTFYWFSSDYGSLRTRRKFLTLHTYVYSVEGIGFYYHPKDRRFYHIATGIPVGNDIANNANAVSSAIDYINKGLQENNYDCRALIHKYLTKQKYYEDFYLLLFSLC